jgi:AcrR family transcriptional regulator
MDRRQALKDSAIRLFVKEGFQQASTARVSREAGVATGTLFTYFDSKDDMINTVYSESKTEMIRFVTQKLNTKDAPQKTIKSIWKFGVKWALENPNQYRYIQLYEASAYGLTSDENSLDPIQKLVVSCYQELVDGITPLPNKLLLRIVNSNQHALIDYLLVEKDGNYEKALAKQMLELTLTGLVK